MMKCQKCNDRDLTAQPQIGRPGGFRVLCAECNVDVRTSSTRKVAFEAREVEDRYTLMARKYNV
jgi:hypothetical protein